MKIKQTIKSLILFIAMGAGLLSVTVPVTVSAQTCGSVKTSIISCGTDDTSKSDGTHTAIWDLLIMVINIMTAGVGVLAVAGIVYGSVRYAAAGGSAEEVKKAREIITNVVIGIVAYALMYSLLNYLIPGGLFNHS